MNRKETHIYENHIPTDRPTWHPEHTNILLVWTQTGNWVQVPMLEGFVGGDSKSYKVAWKEKYINEEGKQKKAISYGVDQGLTVWYDMEEMRRAQPQWIPHKEDRYENTRDFYLGLKSRKSTIHVDNMTQASQQHSYRGSYSCVRGGRAR